MEAKRFETGLGCSMLMLLCSVTFAEADKERTIMDSLSKAVDASDSYKTYVESKHLMILEACKAAEQLLHKVMEDCAKTGTNIDSVEQTRLIAVARDAWPFLSEEWLRMQDAAPSLERTQRERIIQMCWSAVGEERALELLATRALAKKDIHTAAAVETISGVYHGQVAEFTDEARVAYFERFAKWWEGYRVPWAQTVKLRYKQR